MRYGLLSITALLALAIAKPADAGEDAAAKAYLSMVESDLPVRFDLVALQGEKVTLYKGAFCEEEPCSHAY